jgi:hypothetical protein
MTTTSTAPAPAASQEVAGRRRLYPEDVADLTKATDRPLEKTSIYRYNSASKDRRRRRRPMRAGDMPPPDGHTRRKGPPSPYWYPETITPWIENRPRSGRPRTS